ncbi:MAG: radical SAM protein [Candidatus Omnitrophota bacterium]|nr:MAG: radical SAM protein [Candidatus Omnitrophota bacterium]
MLITDKRKAKLFKSLRVVMLPYLPFTLGIETGNICNLRCPLCPTGAQDTSMRRGFMDLVTFKNIIGQFKDSVSTLNLYSWGEPLLNPELVEMVKYAKKIKRNLRIITSTNLNVKNNSLLEGLISSEIDEIIVSCDGASREAYSKYRVGGDYDLVIKNMSFLKELQKKYNSKTQIIWNFLVFRHNEHEIEAAKNKAHSLGVELRLGKMRTFMKDEILKPHKESIERYKEWIPDNQNYSAYDKEKNITRIKIKTCRKPWQEISINWNGEVLPCCAVYGDEFSFGNIKEGSIKAIWNNSKYSAARREILNSNKPASTICGICRDNGFMHM